ncbi:thrombospondin type 3 repeat-containing protein [Thermodesulfobacteriota bacterium]
MKDSYRYGNLFMRCIPSLLFCITLLLTCNTTLSARPFRLGKLPDKGKNFRCQTCHVNPKPDKEFTPFGSDYRRIGLKAGDIYTKDLGKLDSDGDGFSNDQEFTAGTNPGNPGSKPARVK